MSPIHCQNEFSLKENLPSHHTQPGKIKHAHSRVNAVMSIHITFITFIQHRVNMKKGAIELGEKKEKNAV